MFTLRSISSENLPGVTTFHFSLAVPLDLSGKVPRHKFRNLPLARLARMTEKMVSLLAKGQKTYKYNYKTPVCETPIFKTKEQVNVHRPSIAVHTKNAITTARRTCHKMLPISNEPYLIDSVQQHTLTVHKHGISNSISINRVTLTTSGNTNANRAE